MQNNKAELIISALLSHPTVREASESLKIPESTIYNYLRKNEFKSKYKKAKTDLLQQNTAYLQAKIAEATLAIIEIMNSSETPPQSRISAARTVLEYALKLTEETEILTRIESLESQFNDS